MNSDFNLARSIATAARMKKTSEQDGLRTSGLDVLTVALLCLMIDDGWYLR